MAFVGSGVAALAAIRDPATQQRRMTAAGLRMAAGSDRATPTIIEVQLLVDERGADWTVGGVVHTTRGRRPVLPVASQLSSIHRVRPHLTPTHTLTEVTTGLDLVARQFGLAAGSYLIGSPLPLAPCRQRDVAGGRTPARLAGDHPGGVARGPVLPRAAL